MVTHTKDIHKKSQRCVILLNNFNREIHEVKFKKLPQKQNNCHLLALTSMYCAAAAEDSFGLYVLQEYSRFARLHICD
jgi:hypothetical protein